MRQITNSELRMIYERGVAWEGVTRSKYGIPPELLKAEQQGLISRNPEGEGYIIGPQGLKRLDVGDPDSARDRALLYALHRAIASPKGVVPVEAEPFYNQHHPGLHK